jgi:hypothetical protein
MNRRSTPKVKNGRVQKKNNWAPTVVSDALSIERERPLSGYRHVLSPTDIRRFVELLPDWEELSRGLERIVLSRETDAMGWHEPGSIHLCPWEAELWWDDADTAWLAEHQAVLDDLGVEREETASRVACKWTEPQARAFMLLHVFLHELGHHHDRVTTQSGRHSARGEPYASATRSSMQSRSATPTSTRSACRPRDARPRTVNVGRLVAPTDSPAAALHEHERGSRSRRSAKS